MYVRSCYPASLVGFGSDVVIDPSKSVLVEIKGAELTPTDQFSAGYALRFPRVLRLRLDKVWSVETLSLCCGGLRSFNAVSRVSMSVCRCRSYVSWWTKWVGNWPANAKMVSTCTRPTRSAGRNCQQSLERFESLLRTSRRKGFQRLAGCCGVFCVGHWLGGGVLGGGCQRR